MRRREHPPLVRPDALTGGPAAARSHRVRRRFAGRAARGRLRRHRVPRLGRAERTRARSRRRSAAPWSRIDPRASGVRGASRTDAGVHAEGQLVAFDTSRDIPPRGWVLGLNQHLPDDVAVRVGARRSRPASSPASPRAASAIVTACSSTRSAIRAGARARGASRRSTPTRSRARRSAAVGTHDFAAFRSAGDERDEHGAHAHRASPSSARPTRASSASSSRGTRSSTTWCASSSGTMVDVGARPARAGARWRARSVARARAAPGRPRPRTGSSSSTSTSICREGARASDGRRDAGPRAWSRCAAARARARARPIAALWRELWDAHEAWGGYPGSRDPRVYAQLAARLDDDARVRGGRPVLGRHVHLVADLDGAPCGQVEGWFERHGAAPTTPLTCEVRSLIVGRRARAAWARVARSSTRSRGRVARSLARGAPCVLAAEVLEPNPAHAFYARVGYAPVAWSARDRRRSEASARRLAAGRRAASPCRRDALADRSLEATLAARRRDAGDVRFDRPRAIDATLVGAIAAHLAADARGLRATRRRSSRSTAPASSAARRASPCRRSSPPFVARAARAPRPLRARPRAAAAARSWRRSSRSGAASRASHGAPLVELTDLSAPGTASRRRARRPARGPGRASSCAPRDGARRGAGGRWHALRARDQTCPAKGTAVRFVPRLA